MAVGVTIMTTADSAWHIGQRMGTGGAGRVGRSGMVAFSFRLGACPAQYVRTDELATNPRGVALKWRTDAVGHRGLCLKARAVQCIALCLWLTEAADDRHELVARNGLS